MMSFGYLFSLDNFGIGCMPVGNLAKVPFVGVKFDKSFSKDIKSDETRIIIEDTIKLFNKLDKKSVCTGIENSDDAMAVEKLKPDYLQGYYYSKPLRLEELIQFLKINNFNI
jgi:EAL domain-containing protein (putative c-di-GMP-specific phosphodiesterase class I)